MQPERARMFVLINVSVFFGVPVGKINQKRRVPRVILQNLAIWTGADCLLLKKNITIREIIDIVVKTGDDNVLDFWCAAYAQPEASQD